MPCHYALFFGQAEPRGCKHACPYLELALAKTVHLPCYLLWLSRSKVLHYVRDRHRLLQGVVAAGIAHLMLLQRHENFTAGVSCDNRNSEHAAADEKK